MDPAHAISAANSDHAPASASPQDKSQKDANLETWSDLVKGSKRLQRKGTPFKLSFGESCVEIPDSIIEKNRKAWDNFILGQFYSDPPPQGTVHAIVNGIWSKRYRDISVSKMEGNAYLFRIPNALTKSRVLAQRLWQIEGQTMFVAKWQPGPTQKKPELTSAPIWLELRNVPLQYFNSDGLEYIAGQVGHPVDLHPSTANLTNLEVAKVLTIIDPRKPLPEAVNVKFSSGEIVRILTSSPWMPPICSHCKGIGHNIKRWPTAPITCTVCSATGHDTEHCPRAKPAVGKKKSKSKRSSTVPSIEIEIGKSKEISTAPTEELPLTTPDYNTPTKVVTVGESSETICLDLQTENSPFTPKNGNSSDLGDSPVSGSARPGQSEAGEIKDSSISDKGNGKDDDHGFVEVVSKRQLRSTRGRGPKPT